MTETYFCPSRSLFGKNGNRYRLVRYPIGGCDFSVEPYTYEPADAVNDTKLLQFNLTQYDTDFRVKLLADLNLEI